MIEIDLHTHSRFFHGFAGRPTPYDRIGARLHVAVARARGLDGIAVTNHDYYEAFDFDTGDVTVIPGIEVSSTAGHMLVVGPDPPRRTAPGELTPGEVVDIARDRDCAVILAHPYRNSHLPEMDVAVDAVEVNGKRSRSVDRIETLARDRDLPIVAGSDAHYPFEIGRAYTVLDADSATPASVVEAIEDGRTDFRRVDRFPDRYSKPIYALVHRLKGHTDPPTEIADAEQGRRK
ncbi:MAG: CehA/McbA family metallohydrolase [Halanaeroarchaeum sp.]